MANYEDIVNEAYEDKLSTTLLNNTQSEYNNNEQKIYDADTVYQDGIGFRIEGIDAPEMPTVDLKLERLEKAKESKLGRLVSKATAGEAAKLEAELSILDGSGINNLNEVTGHDIYGRNTVKNTEYQNDMVARGYAVPAFDNQTEEGVKLMEEAIANKLGLWADPEYAAEMEAKRELRTPKGSTDVRFDTDGYLGNLVDAVQYGLGRTAASTADMAVDLATRGAKEVAQVVGGVTEEQANKIIQQSAIKRLFNDKGNFIGLDKYKEGKEYGYDSKRVDQYTEEFKYTMNDPKATVLDKAWVTLKAVTQAPEVLTSSMGDIMLAMMPGGLGVFAANFANDVLEERQAIKGTSDLDVSDYGIATAAGAVAGTVNMLTGGMAGISKGAAAKVIKDGISKMDAGTFTKLATAVGVGTLEEATEESIQTLAEIVGTKLDTSKEDEILTKESALEIGLSAALGGGAGGLMGGTRGSVEAFINSGAISNVADKISNIRNGKVVEEDNKTSSTKFGSTLDGFEASVANGRAGLNTKEFKKFFEDNKNELSIDETKRVQSIFNTYKQNVSNVRESLIDEEGKVNKDVLRAEPVAVEELLKLVMNKNLTDEEAEGFIGQLTKEDFAEYEDIDVSRIQDKIRRIRNKSKEADSELSAFESVNKDIFENGYLQYDSIAEALNSGNIMQKESFLQYEKAKADKLESAIETTKSNLENIHGGDLETIKALAYLEGVNTAKDSAVNPEFEKEMIIAAAKLIGVSTEGKTYVNLGKEAREKYKGSNWQKAVKDATTTIEGFTNAFQSTTEGRFEVNAWEALGELVETNFANSGKMRTPGYRKVANVLESEVGLISKFINLDKEAEFTRDELVSMLKADRTKKDEVPKETVTEGNKVEGEELPTVAEVGMKIIKDGTVGAKTEQEQELRRLLDVYSGEESKSQGGGYVENVTNKDGYLASERDEDIAAGSIVKGFTYSDIKKLLPKLKGTPATALRAVDMYFNERNRQKAVVSKVKYLIELLEEVKKDRTVAEYLGVEFTEDDSVFLPGMLKETPIESESVVEEGVDRPETKVEDIVIEEEVEPEPFPGTVADARDLEKEKGKELAKEIKELRDDKKWLDASYKVLKELFTEANNIRNTYQPLLDDKFKEKEQVKKDLDKVIKEIANIKQDIDKAKSDEDNLNNKTRDNLVGAIKKILEDLRKIGEAIGLLSKRKKEAYKVKAKLEARLKEINDEISELLEVKESRQEELAEVEENISNQKESIATQEAGIRDRVTKIKEISADRNILKNVFKPGTKSVADQMLTSSEGFSGWNEPLNKETAEGLIKTEYALTDVLELSNSVAPLAVVRYKALTDEHARYEEIISDVNKLVNQLVIDKNGNGTSIKSVAKGLYQYGDDKSKTFTTDVMAYNAPALSFMLSKNSSLEVRDNVAIAMEVAMNEWLMNDAIASDELTAKDVAKYYGMDEQDVSDELLRQLQKLGIPVRFMAENIGDKVLKHAGFKVTGKDVDEKIELSTRLKESLGMYVMHLAQKKGQVTIQNKEFNEVATMMGKEEDATAEDVTVTTLVFKYGAKEFGKTNWSERKEDLGVIEQYKGVSFSRPSLKNVKANIKRNKVTNAPKKLLEAKKDAMLREWHLKGIDGESVVAELFTMDRNTVMKAMGFLAKEELDKLPFMLQGPASSKNRQIMTSVDSLFDLADKLKDGQELNSFWFDYFIGKNNRTYLDSDGVNNQSDKFHRHLIYTEGQRATVVPGERSEQIWKIGVAQAFGYDVDKMKVEESIEFAEKMLANASEIEAGWKLVKETGAKSFMVAGKEIKVKEMGHLVDGIQAVRDYVEANGNEFETSLLIEADAVTSGFALKMLQLIGNLDESLGYGSEITGREWLRKVGIFIDEKGNLLGNKDIVDGYKTLGKNMTSANIEASVKAIMDNPEDFKHDDIISSLGAKDAEDAVKRATEVSTMFTDIIGELTNDKGEVSKIARDLFKPPFMTFMYGAGFAKINKELAAMIIDLIMNKVAKYDSLSKEEKAALDKLMSDVTGLPKVGAKLMFMTKDLKEEKSKAKGQEIKSIYDVMEGYITSSFGVTVEATMRKEFENIIQINEAIMEINNAVFSVFDQKFKEKLKETELTLDNVDKITSELFTSFPVVKGPLSEGTTDGIALFKTEIAKGLKDMFTPKYSNAGGYFADSDGKLTSRGVNHVIRVYKEAAAAAGVIPIHTLDGATMAMTVIGKDVQQIFDAIVGGVGNIEEIVTDYNRNAYELSMKWDFLYEVLEMGNRVLGDPANKDYVVNYINKRNEKRPFNLDLYINPLIEFAEYNAKFKEEFKAKSGIIEHMVFSEKTAYETNSKEITPKEILSKVSPAVMTKLNKELEKPLEEMFKDCSKG